MSMFGWGVADAAMPRFDGLVKPPRDGLPTIQEISDGLTNMSATLFWLGAYSTQVDNQTESRVWPTGFTINAWQPVIFDHLYVRMHLYQFGLIIRC
jgi:hypothetical protein